MPRLLRRNLRCHYCNITTRNEHGGIPKHWQCPHCEAVNFLDERGNITDPPLEATTVPAPSIKYARSRSPTPAMSVPPSDALFCDTCQRNQLILNNTMAEYIPDEDDPQYKKYVDSAEEYRAELEERYPQVCEFCIDRVQDRIRASGYAAKADHLRRVLEESKKYKTKESTPRQVFTLVMIWLAKWTYLGSVLVGLLWHTLGMMTTHDRPRDYDFRICTEQALFLRDVDESCFNSSEVLKIVKYALVADLLTIWWNPRLKEKTNRSGGRMRGLISVWVLRFSVLSLRYASLFLFTTVQPENQQWFNYIHACLFAILLTSTGLAWKSVTITYHSTRALLQPLDAHLPSAPHSVEKERPTAYATSRPINDSFDTMAQHFTSSFTGEPSSACPPSPTFTAMTSDTEDSEWATPFSAARKTRSSSRRPKTPNDMDMDMDWTPTQRRFANNPPTVVPLSFGPRPTQSQPQPPPQPPLHHSPPQSHSIFSRPDPNPFRHKVPAAPRGSLAPKAAQINPWNAPGSTHVPVNFFKEAKKFGERSMQQRSDGAGNPQDSNEDWKQWSVPKKVKMEAELFQGPRFKFDGEGLARGVRDTGLEEGFNGLFSK